MKFRGRIIHLLLAVVFCTAYGFAQTNQSYDVNIGQDIIITEMDVPEVVPVNMYVGSCPLEVMRPNQDEIIIPWDQLSQCLSSEFDFDGTPGVFPGGLTIIVAGETEYQRDLVLTMPSIDVQWQTLCEGPIQGTQRFIYQRQGDEYDAAFSSSVYVSHNGSSAVLTSTYLLGSGGSSSFGLVSPELADGLYDFRVELENGNGSQGSASLVGCLIDNSPPGGPTKDYDIVAGNSLFIDLSDYEDAGVGIQNISVYFAGVLLGATSQESIEIDWEDLNEAGVTTCESGGTVFNDRLEFHVEDLLGQNAVFANDITCYSADNQAPEEENTDEDEIVADGDAETIEDDVGKKEVSGGSDRVTTSDESDSNDTDRRDTENNTYAPRIIPSPISQISYDDPLDERVEQLITTCEEQSPCEKSFDDLVDHWSRGYVQIMNYNCVVGGVGGGNNFAPDQPVLNGEAIKMAVVSIFGDSVYVDGGEVTYQGATYFDDTPLTEWSTVYWSLAYEQGWVEGLTKNNKVHPSTPMSRSKAVRLLANMYLSLYNAELPEDIENPFSDLSADSEDYLHILLAYKLGIVNGVMRDGQVYFQGDRPVTRGEFSKIVSQSFGEFLIGCGAVENEQWLKGWLNDLRDGGQEDNDNIIIDTTILGILSTTSSQLEIQGVAPAGLIKALKSLRKTETNTLLGEATNLINEYKEYFRTTTGQPCPPELLEKLIAMKTALEKQATTLEKEVNKTNKKMDQLASEIEAVKKTIEQLKKDIEQKKKDIENTQGDIDAADQKVQDLDQELTEKKERVRELQRILTNNGNVTEHIGDAPLGGLDSGAALSFDGGETWVVANGNTGVEELLGNMEGSQDIMRELRQLEKDIRKLKKEKEEAEKEKEEAEEKKEEQEKDLEKLEGDLEQAEKDLKGKEKELQNCEDLLKSLKQQIAQLNSKIDEFNRLAKQCGIQARRAYAETRRKLENMPPEDRVEAEEQFEESTTEEEEDAIDDPTGDVDQGGAGLASAARKLEDAMRGVSDCPPPQTKYGEWSVDSTNTKEIRGTDTLYISNFKGTRGLSNNSQIEVMGDLMKGIEWISFRDTILSIGELASSLNPMSLIYSEGFQNQATDAIVNKLQERQREGLLRGLPEWIEVTFGPLWKFTITQTDSSRPRYECQDGIWQREGSEYMEETEMSACEYLTSQQETYMHNINLSTLNTTVDDDRTAAYKEALKTTLERKVGGPLIGDCEAIQDAID